MFYAKQKDDPYSFISKLTTKKLLSVTKEFCEDTITFSTEKAAERFFNKVDWSDYVTIRKI